MPFIPTCVAQQSPGQVGKTISSALKMLKQMGQSWVKSVHLYRDEPTASTRGLARAELGWNRNRKALWLGTRTHRCCMGAKTATEVYGRQGALSYGAII